MAALLAALLVACGGGVDGPAGDHHEDHGHEHEHAETGEAAHADLEAAGLAWAKENYPTRDEMLAARACTEEATGFEFGPLPDDFGTRGVEDPDPALVAEAVAAPPEIDVAFTQCVFELGLEDSFYPPDQHAPLLEALDPNN